MTTNEETDIELLRRFQKGEDDAFDQIVQRFQDRVFRMAAVWLFDEQYTEDAAQEVFMRGFRGLRSFRFRSAPFTWLYRTTKNVCREFNRRRQFDALDVEPADPSAGMEALLNRHQAARRVRELVAVLPRRQREVVVLRVFEDCSVRETAKAMGCREGTVKALLYKATARLKLNLKSMDKSP